MAILEKYLLTKQDAATESCFGLHIVVGLVEEDASLS
jgi:hypothetical protein